VFSVFEVALCGAKAIELLRAAKRLKRGPRTAVSNEQSMLPLRAAALGAGASKISQAVSRKIDNRHQRSQLPVAAADDEESAHVIERKGGRWRHPMKGNSECLDDLDANWTVRGSGRR
jgi:hypothetical protein